MLLLRHTKVHRGYANDAKQNVENKKEELEENFLYSSLIHHIYIYKRVIGCTIGKPT